MKSLGWSAGDIRNQEIADGNKMKPEDAVQQYSERAEQILGMQWRCESETFGDLGMQFVE